MNSEKIATQPNAAMKTTLTQNTAMKALPTKNTAMQTTPTKNTAMKTILNFLPRRSPAEAGAAPQPGGGGSRAIARRMGGFWVLALLGLLTLRASAQLTVESVVTTNLSEPYGVAVDSGNVVYVTDSVNHRVIRFDPGTGLSTTLAGITGVSGTNDGPSQSARLNTPQGLALANVNGVSGLIVGDTGNHLIRFINLTNGAVSTLAGTAGLAGANDAAVGRNAKFRVPIGVAVDSAGILYIADSLNNVIRQINLADPNFGVTTLAVAGTTLYQPTDVAVQDANHLWVADTRNHAIKLITRTGATNATLTTLVGSNDQNLSGSADNALGVDARFSSPRGILWLSGTGLVIADTANHTIRLATNNPVFGATNYGVVTFAGVAGQAGFVDGLVLSANFRYPHGLARDALGNGLLIADLKNNAIRRIQIQTGFLPLFDGPMGIALDSASSRLYIADQTNNVVQVLNFGDNSTTTFVNASAGINTPVAVAVDAANNVFVLNQGTGSDGSILEFDSFGNTLATKATGLTQPTALTLDGYGNLFVAEQGGAVKVFGSGLSNAIVTVTNAGVNLQGIALFDDGAIAVSDAGNHVIWQIHPITRAITLLTGTPGISGSTLGASNFAKLYQPRQLARAVGNKLVAADGANNRLVVVERSGAITNVLNSTNANVWFGRPGDPVGNSSTRWVSMVSPVGVAVSAAGTVYASETLYRDIRGALATGLAQPPAGPFNVLPYFNGPMGVALDSTGNNLYIADQTNNVVQVLNFSDNQTIPFVSSGKGVNRPVAVAVDEANNVFVLNQGTGSDGSILEFDSFGNALATKATGLTQPTALTLDGYGNLFVAEQGGAVKVFGSGLSNAIVTVTNAGVNLQGIALFDDGAIAVSDAGNHVVWQIHPITKAVTLLTGTPGVSGNTLGDSNFAKLYQPRQLARAAGNKLVAADFGNDRLVVVERSGTITNVLNSANANVWFGQLDDPAGASSTRWVSMVSPVGVAVSAAGTVYTSETAYRDIRGLLATGLAQPPPGPFNVLPYFNGPMGIALDSSGGNLYIADQTNNVVQVLNFGDNSTTAFVSTGDGINRPVAVVVDATNNIFVLNQGTGTNGSILEFDSFGNALATKATGLTQPTALTLDGYGNLFVAEQSGTVKVFGSGLSNAIVTVTNAGVNLQGIALFDDGAIAVSDAGNHVIWQIHPITKAVTLLTGTLGISGSNLGASNFARLYQPRQLARAGGNKLVTADSANNRLVVVERSGAITNVLTSTNANVWFGRPGDPVGNSSTRWVSMRLPVGVAVSAAGTVYTSETLYRDIRGVLATGLAQPPPGPFNVLPYFNGPMGIALDSSGGNLYIADQTNNVVRVLAFGDNSTTAFVGASDGINQPVAVAVDATNNIFVLNQGTGSNGSVLEFDSFGNLLATKTTGLTLPTALTLDGNDNIFVAEQGGAVKVFGPGLASAVATITNAGVNLQGIALFDDGAIAVSDAGNHVIWQIDPTTRAVTLLTGTPGISGSTLGASNFAKLYQPRQLARAAGNKLVTADSGNNRLVVVERSGAITNVLNSANANVWFGRPGDPVGTSSTRWVAMVSPVGVAVSAAGTVYTSETLYRDIRGVLATGLAQPLPGPYNVLPYFNSPMGVALDSTGNYLFIADATNNAVQRLGFSDNVMVPFATSSLNRPVAMVLDLADNVYVLNQGNGSDGFILKFNKFGNLLATNATTLVNPTAITMDPATNLFVCELGGSVKRFGPSGNATLATVTNLGTQLRGIAVLADGMIAVSDSGNHAIRLINPLSGGVSLLTGNNGAGSNIGIAAFAQLNQPHHLAKAGGDLLVVTDSGNDRLVVVNRSGTLTNLSSGNSLVWFGLPGDPVAPGASRFVPMRFPAGLAIAASGDLFTGEVYYRDIRKITGTGLTGPEDVFVPAAPTIYPFTGYFPMGQTITVNNGLQDVFYTTDGTEPTPASPRVTMTPDSIGFVGSIHWVNQTNDLTALRVKAFIGTNASATISGLPAAANNVGVPPGPSTNLLAGIGSTIVVPVVANLRSNDTVRSYIFRVEVAPNGTTNRISSQFRTLDVSTNDFIKVITSAQADTPASISVVPYINPTNNTIRGLEISALGTTAGVSFTRFAVVALLAVPIPINAIPGQTYSIYLLESSATSDGVQAAVDFPPMLAATILVTNVAYTVGDSSPGGWYNAGQFGNHDLDNADVNNAFYAAAGLRLPYSFSDVFNAMDAYPEDDTGFVGGDGEIRFLDWELIRLRALGLNTNNWLRAWSSGGNHTNVSTTLIPGGSTSGGGALAAAAPWNRQAKVAALPVGNVVAGNQVSVPVYVTTANAASLAGLQFRGLITPDNGGPALASGPVFIPAAAGPTFARGFKPNELACGWELGSLNFGSRSSNYLGALRFSVPPGALPGHTYTVSFANADGSPDLTTQYTFESKQATVSVGTPAAPITDITSDEWKLQFFTSLTSPDADPNADPDHDGVPNWAEYLAGTDPTNAASRLMFNPITTQMHGGQRQVVLSWFSAPGKVYDVQVASTPTSGSWSVIKPVSGNGDTVTALDINPSGPRYYRLRVLP